LALKEIDDVIASGRTPILVGGTGFYLKALLDGLSPIPEANLEIRAQLTEKCQAMGTAQFFEEFKKLDPITAANIDPFNTQRIIRAWEVLISTGKALSAWHKEPLIAPPEYLSFYNLTVIPEREDLYSACNKRFDIMLASGAIDEVSEFDKLYGRNSALPLTKALGYSEISSYLNSEISIDEAREKSQQITRNYAKRQVTWFKNQINANICVNSPKTEFDAILAKINKECF